MEKKFTGKQIMDSAERLFDEFEISKLDKLENGLTGPEWDNYNNMIVYPFETSDKSEVKKDVARIQEIFKEYSDSDLEKISKLKIQALIKENSANKERLEVLNEFKDLLFPEPKKSGIYQIGSMSQEDVAELLSKKEVSEIGLAKKQIQVLINTFEVGKTIKTKDELEKILDKYAKSKALVQLKLIMQMNIDHVVEEIEKIPGYENDSQLLLKIDNLKAISDHFSKWRLE